MYHRSSRAAEVVLCEIRYIISDDMYTFKGILSRIFRGMYRYSVLTNLVLVFTPGT